MLRSGKVDFSAYKKAVKSATMRMFYGSLDQHGKSDGVITMQEWLKIMGQLGDKVRENPDPHHHARLKRTKQPGMPCTPHAGS